MRGAHFRSFSHSSKTKMAKNYYLVDASGKILGRLAVEISQIISGRNKKSFSPNIDGGDFAVVINSDRIVVTGDKRNGKIYHRFSGYSSGITSIKFKDQMKNDSRETIRKAVYGMLPKNKLRKKMMNRMLVYKDNQYDKKLKIINNKSSNN